MGVTGVCAKEHIFRSPGSLRLPVNRRTKPMEEHTHKRGPWRKLICVMGALFVMAAPMSGSVCTGRDCAPQNSEAAALCSGMEMHKDAASAIAQSPVACCQLTPIPPATLRSHTDTQDCKAELSQSVTGTAFDGVVATQRMAPRPVDSPPPHDVQSLFCTLLI